MRLQLSSAPLSILTTKKKSRNVICSLEVCDTRVSGKTWVSSLPVTYITALVSCKSYIYAMNWITNKDNSLKKAQNHFKMQTGIFKSYVKYKLKCVITCDLKVSGVSDLLIDSDCVHPTICVIRKSQKCRSPPSQCPKYPARYEIPIYPNQPPIKISCTIKLNFFASPDLDFSPQKAAICNDDILQLWLIWTFVAINIEIGFWSCVPWYRMWAM